MSYDNWKQATPEGYDFEAGKTCDYCGEPVQDDKQFCNDNCKKGYWND